MHAASAQSKLADQARKRQGQEGEDRAASLLQEKGYRVVDRNFKSRFGELDLIVEKEDLLVFVEVRSRASDWFSSPLHTINWSKQRKVVFSAMDYIRKAHVRERPLRFDVISIAGRELQHIENAFDAGR
jgi:putative endonuclease